MNKDKTGTERQQRRREREREWLKTNGFTSWEQVHTMLMKKTAILARIERPKKEKRRKNGNNPGSPN